MKKLLAITTFVIVTASNIFTLAWANEYTDVYIRLAGEVEVGEQVVASYVEEDHTSFYTSAKELSPQPVTKDDTFNKEIKLLPDRAGLLNSNGFKLFGAALFFSLKGALPLPRCKTLSLLESQP